MNHLKALATVALLASAFLANPQAARAQDLGLAPLSWDFGEAPLGSPVARYFTGTSIGSSDVSIYLIQIRPDTTGTVVCGEDVPCDFAVASAPNLPLIMPPGAQTVVEVAFTPSAIGSTQAFLYLRSNDTYPPPGSVAYIPLAGVGVENPADLPIPARVYLNKPGKTKLVSKGTFALPDPSTDNPVTEGAAITFTEGVASETILLPSSNWTALGNPPGSKGFRYKDASGATCSKVLVKGTVVKALCQDTAPGAPPFDSGSDPAISVVLSVGTPARRYCAECPNGGAQKGSPASRTKLTDCLAPVTCPPSTMGLCCDFPTGCASAPSAIACLETAGGTTVGGGAVCDASGDCVTPPASPGNCCEGTAPYPLCTMVVDQTTCEGGGGTFHASAICRASGACTL